MMWYVKLQKQTYSKSRFSHAQHITLLLPRVTLCRTNCCCGLTLCMHRHDCGCVCATLQAMTVQFVCGIWTARHVSRKSRLIVRSLRSLFTTLHFIHRNHSSPVPAPTRWQKCLRDSMTLLSWCRR